MAEYIAIADHMSEYNKSFSYVRLKSTDKAFAFGEGARRGFYLQKVYCVHICKKIKKNSYRSVGLIYPNGEIRDVQKEEHWSNCIDFYVPDNEFEKTPYLA